MLGKGGGGGGREGIGNQVKLARCQHGYLPSLLRSDESCRQRQTDLQRRQLFRLVVLALKSDAKALLEQRPGVQELRAAPRQKEKDSGTCRCPG